MNGRCETDPLDRAVDVCDSCFGEFCETCLLRPKGRRHPVCTECALIASGVRKTNQPRILGAKRTAKNRRAVLSEQAGADDAVFKYFDSDNPLDASIDPPVEGRKRRRKSSPAVVDEPFDAEPDGERIQVESHQQAGGVSLRIEQASALAGGKTAEEEPEAEEREGPSTPAVAKLTELRKHTTKTESTESTASDEPAAPDEPAAATDPPATTDKPPAPRAPTAATDPPATTDKPAAPDVPTAATDPPATTDKPAAPHAPTPTAGEAATPATDTTPAATTEVGLGDCGPADARSTPTPTPTSASTPTSTPTSPSASASRATVSGKGPTSPAAQRGRRKADAHGDAEPKPTTAPMIGEVRTVGGRRQADAAQPQGPLPGKVPATVAASVSLGDGAVNAIEQFDAGRSTPAPANRPGTSSNVEPDADQTAKADTDADGNWIPPILRGIAPTAREAKTNLPKRQRSE